jgi:hypothetical protein
MTDLLNLVGAIATMMMGAMGLFAPQTASKFVGLKSVTTAGDAEFRATYGGLFIGLGLVPLLSFHPLAFAVVGLGWLGAALGRLVSIALDKTVSSKNIGAVGFEVAFGCLLLVGAPWSALF